MLIFAHLLAPFVGFKFKLKAMKKLYYINSNKEPWLKRNKKEHKDQIKIKMGDKCRLFFNLCPAFSLKQLISVGDDMLAKEFDVLRIVATIR